MPLLVLTARLSPRFTDPDTLDVTRATADEHQAKRGLASPGSPFAPSGPLLAEALRRRREAERLRARAGDLFGGEDPAALLARADALEAEAWAWYAPRYREEMLTSWRARRGAWDALLARRRVVLACVCPTEQCHRRLLAGFLVRLGAVDGGELAAGRARRASPLGGHHG